MTQPDNTQDEVRELDNILGELLAATYHYDGKNCHLITPEALAKIKQALTLLISDSNKKLLDSIYQDAKYGEDKTAEEVLSRIEIKLNAIKEDIK